MVAVVVVVVVGFVFVGGGGEQLLYRGPLRAFVWSSKIQTPLIFYFYFKSPCLD